jgi:RecA/RadA recombinase
MSVAIDMLRARIRTLEDRTTVPPTRIPSGLSELDGLIGGLPRPGIIELHGPPGSGRSRLALQLAASQTRRGSRVAWLDLSHTLYPPAASQLQVDLNHVLVVRPPSHEATWAAEQLIRSGNFSLVVVADPGALGRAGARWQLAAEVGQTTVIVLNHRTVRNLPASVRLELCPDAIVVRRNRGGHIGARRAGPDWPARSCPWPS